MKKSDWGPTGVARTNHGLSRDTQLYLREIAGSWREDNSDIDVFVEEVDFAVRVYHGMRDVREVSLPANVREELDQIYGTATKLGKQFGKIGQYSRNLMGIEETETFSNNISQIVQILFKARQKAAELPKGGGRLPDDPKTLLAAQIAHAFRIHMDIEPTSTRSGPFEEILVPVLEAIDPKPGKDTDPSVHDLILKALKVRVSDNPDGVVEFNPKVD